VSTAGYVKLLLPPRQSRGNSHWGLGAQTPGELVAALIPAHGYIPRTLNGVFSTPFNAERDGRITFDPAAAGRYLVQTVLLA
jgi:hypothetical protein